MTIYYAIVTDRITSDQRSAISEVVKRDASGGWWHQFRDAWIAGGQSARHWRDVLGGIITPDGADSLLVLRLPAESQRHWAAYATPTKQDWLGRTYSRDPKLSH